MSSSTEGPEHTLAGPDQVAPEGKTEPTLVEESDPSADSREGLAGDMGVSSERTGPVRGVAEEVTYGVAATHDDNPTEGELPPEQSASDDRPQVNPASPGPHVSDPDSHPGHGV